MKPEKHFWEWFVRHEAELFALRVERPEERELIFDELASQPRDVGGELLKPRSNRRLALGLVSILPNSAIRHGHLYLRAVPVQSTTLIIN